ncbi:DUF4139 domain-containing protein [Kitasatospora sp. NPDC002227]|uniref:DUF4139 domain-containing protein n=1 Tax=Kitasatospora sp. NPDC002227 TaxID=3154773 RepID=UPI00332793F6
MGFDGVAVETGSSWESTLESVVVHAAGALCRRRARGTVPPDGLIVLPGLPAAAEPGSLRARVLDGSGSVTHRVVEVRAEYASELRDASRLPELVRALSAAQDTLEAARERYERQLVRIAEISALRAVPPRSAEGEHRRTPADIWLDLADFVDQRLETLHDRAGKLAEELRLAEHAVQVLEEELARATDTVSRSTAPTTVTARLRLTPTAVLAEAPGGELEIELEYTVPGAHWVPTYRLSHRQGEEAGSLVLRAAVAQRSGEDWTGVRLALSTADLERRTDLPGLTSLRIGRAQPAPAPSGWREPPVGLGELFAGYDTADRPRPATGHQQASRLAPRTRRARRAAEPAPAVAAEQLDTPDFLSPDLPVALSAPLSAPPPSAPQGPGGPPPRAYAAAPAFGGGAGPAAKQARRDSTAPEQEPPQPDAGALRPGPGWLDYGGLVLAGPEETAAWRGRLRPERSTTYGAVTEQARAAKVAELRLPRHAVRPRRSAGSFDHRYDAPAPVDVPSDGGWHTVTIGEIPVSVSREYVCVPAVEPTVYGALVLGNGTDQALLAGPVEVTADGSYLLTTALPTLAPGGRRRVGLGVTEGIKVARRTELRESTAGLRGGTTVLDHRLHIELANRLPHPVTVEVRERVPVSADAEIRIEEKPGWTALDPSDDSSGAGAPGARRRRVELPAHGTAELDGGYEIRIPAGKALLGGNRRY